MGTGACRSVGGSLDEYLVETLRGEGGMLGPKSDSTTEVRVQLCGRFAFLVADDAVHSALPGRRARLPSRVRRGVGRAVAHSTRPGLPAGAGRLRRGVPAHRRARTAPAPNARLGG